MANNMRFFLGYGERLTERIAPPGGGGGPEPAYTFEYAVERLSPLLEATRQELAALPDDACPADEAVGVLTLHPQSMAKSYHPQQLMNEYNLRQVGSRPVDVLPEKWTRKTPPVAAPSTELYVAGKRASFERWVNDLEQQPRAVSEQIRRLEAVRAPKPDERMRNVEAQIEVAGDQSLFEVVLHVSADPDEQYILQGFDRFARSLGADADLRRRLHAGGLCFLPVNASPSVLRELAMFAYLRVARPMPRLRPTIERSTSAPRAKPAPLPSEGPLDPDLRIAVFDGGLRPVSPLTKWANSYEPSGVGAPEDGQLAHGHDVTSATLFGALRPGVRAERPFGTVDHYRVLDKDSQNDPYELYNVLHRVEEVLRARRHEFINLSIGPALPVEDDEVHPWTALLDEYLSDGHALATIAVGNTGVYGRDSGEARIQVPADCVNALSVGAVDSTRNGWQPASYSSFGPGRSPGRIKPEIVQFGGDDTEGFFVYDPEHAPRLATTAGTSFAAPSALRLAVGLRAHFGTRLSPLALKALLIHSAESNGHDRDAVGWGRVAADINDIALCSDGMVRVIYQGELAPASYVRALLPMPQDAVSGNVKVEATFCYASPTDPQDPGNYTRSGLSVTFRKDARAFARADSTVPKPTSFFKKSEFDSEHELRNDAHRWETTMHAAHTFRGVKLYQPMFDIHYNARTGGGAARNAGRIPYALVVTLRAPRARDLYDQVMRTYAGQLEALSPVIEIPVRVR
jgi:Subtilase family